MMNHVLSMDGFYFSTTYDLTHTLQRLSNTSPEFQEMSLLERVSLIFCFKKIFNLFFNFQEHASISSIKYILIFLSPGCIRIMYAALKTYHVSSRYHTSKFKIPKKVYFTDRIKNHICAFSEIQLEHACWSFPSSQWSVV